MDVRLYACALLLYKQDSHMVPCINQILESLYLHPDPLKNVYVYIKSIFHRHNHYMYKILQRQYLYNTMGKVNILKTSNAIAVTGYEKNLEKSTALYTYICIMLTS